MSFRKRLSLFFLLIVVLPIAAVAVLVIRVSGELDRGRSEAVLSQVASTTTALYRQEQFDARKEIAAMVDEKHLRSAWRHSEELENRLRAAIHSGELYSAVAYDSAGNQLFSLGGFRPLASVEISSDDTGPGEVERLLVSTTGAAAFLNRVASLHGQNLILSNGSRVIASTVPGSKPPPEGDRLQIANTTYYTRTIALERGTAPLQLTVLYPRLHSSPLESRPLLVIAVIVLLAASAAFGLRLQRGMHSQIEAILAAARRIGAGDFSAKVPSDGNDELAALADELNSMSVQLKERVDQIERQRQKIEAAVRRTGQAFASGLDFDGIEALALRMSAEMTDSPWAMLCREGTEPRFRGDPPAPARELLIGAAQRRRVEAGEGRAGALDVIASPLKHPQGLRMTLAVARDGDDPFGATEQRILDYLADQVAVSLENALLHQTISHQAITDDLTELSNSRRFHDQLERETERAERFEHELALLMIDLDRFKVVNDTHGHLQGDEVLRQVAAVIKHNLRDVDDAARYGGEELAVILPETGKSAAVEAAERIRAQVAELRVPLLAAPGTVAVTISIGVAAYPDDGRSPTELIAAADRALYAAKNDGRNLVRAS